MLPSIVVSVKRRSRSRGVLSGSEKVHPRVWREIVPKRYSIALPSFCSYQARSNRTHDNTFQRRLGSVRGSTKEVVLESLCPCTPVTETHGPGQLNAKLVVGTETLLRYDMYRRRV